MKVASDIASMASALTAEAVMLTAYLSERLTKAQKREKTLTITNKVMDSPEVKAIICEPLLTQLSRWLLSF